MIKAATQSGRKYAFLGTSLERIYAIGRTMGYFDNVPNPIPFEEISKTSKSEIVLLCTGSQGEDRAALGKLARGIHPAYKLSAGDTVIFSSKIIPGNEKPVFKILNQLTANGVKVVTSKMIHTHVSGHPCADELTEIYQTIKPKYAIPVHGEERHMQRHAQIAMQAGVRGTEIPHNGDIIEIAPHFGWVDSVKSGRLCVDGGFLEDAYKGMPSERRRLGYAGCANIFLHLDADNNLIAKPEIITWGVPAIAGGDEQETLNLYQTIIIEAFYNLEDEIMDKDSEIAEAIRRTFRREVSRIWGKKPMTKVVIHKIKPKKNAKKKKN